MMIERIRVLTRGERDRQRLRSGPLRKRGTRVDFPERPMSGLYRIDEDFRQRVGKRKNPHIGPSSKVWGHRKGKVAFGLVGGGVISYEAKRKPRGKTRRRN